MIKTLERRKVCFYYGQNRVPKNMGGGGKFTPGPVPTALQKGMYSVFLCVSIITIANIIG